MFTPVDSQQCNAKALAQPGESAIALERDRKGQFSILSKISTVIALAGPTRDRRTSRSWTITEVAKMLKNGMRPVHPGEVHQEEYLKPLSMSANALAKALSVPAPRINDVVRERRGISADTAMRLARYFGGDARSGLNLQGAYDLRVAKLSNAKLIARELSPATHSP